MSKPTESQDAIELLHMEINETPGGEKRALLIVEKLPAIKRAYSARLKEIEKEEANSIERPAKDAPVDELIAFNEKRKLREYQGEVRLQTIERLERQVALGKVHGWAHTTHELYEGVHDMVTGNMLEK